MYCGTCGAQIASDALFCPKCGAATGKKAAAEAPLTHLVALAREGEQIAVSELYERTYSKVYYTVKSMIKDEDTVFDVLQDSYVKAFTRLDRLGDDDRFLPWIRTIAANTARDWLKKQRPLLFSELESEDCATPVEERFADEREASLPEQVIDREETKRLLREIIDELPEDQRAAIGMYYYEELSIKQIAAAMGATENAVKSRLLYGRRKIEKKVRELEKRGTKLYSLSPIPFLLLLFRSQKAHAAAADPRMLRGILARLPSAAGAAAGGTAAGGAAAGGTAAISSAATAGGVGAVKIALIGIAAAAVVAGGAFGISRLARRSEPPQQAPLPTITAPAEAPQPPQTEAPAAEPVPETAEPTQTEAPDPVEEALEAYRKIIAQADTYDFGEYLTPSGEYDYALVQLRREDTVPTLLLGMQSDDYMHFVRVFQYDPNTNTVIAPMQTLMEGVAQLGGYRGSLMMLEHGDGIEAAESSAGTGDMTIMIYLLEEGELSSSLAWSGPMGNTPDRLKGTPIDWHPVSDGSALDRWEPSAETDPPQTEGPEAQTDARDRWIAREEAAGRLVLTGTVVTYDYDAVVRLQGMPDPNGGVERGKLFRLIILDPPQTLTLNSVDGMYSSTAQAFKIESESVDPGYDGQTVTFSIDPKACYWPSDTSMPLGAPWAFDVRIYTGG